MAISNNRPVVSDLEFASIKEDILAHFRDRPEFADYDFTGSALNLLVDVLAYNTHYNALTANFMLSEMFLDSAMIRANVVSLAEHLNYTPRSSAAAFTTVTLRFTKQNPEDHYPVIIPGGTVFTAAAGNGTYSFHTLEDYSFQFKELDPTGTTIDLTVTVYEGKFRTQRFINDRASSDFSRFELAQDSIDTSHLRVEVNGIRYERIEPLEENIFTATRNSKIYFVEESRNGYPIIVFGNDVVGEAIDVHDEVIISYLQTNGVEGNGIRNFTTSIGNRPEATIVSVNGASSGGAGRETVQEIKDFAPKWFQTQYRATTADDYEAILRKKYADIQAITVYGGDEVYTPGKVYIVVKPKSADALTSGTKDLLKREIIKEYNVVTVTPEFIDPQIVNIVLDTVIVYDESKLVSSPSALRSKVANLYSYFNSNYISDFLSTFHESNFSYELRSLDDSVVSSNTRVSLSVETGVKDFMMDTMYFDLGNRLYHPEDGFRSSRGGILKSDLFMRRGQAVFSGLDDNGYGKIRLYNLVDGEKVYITEDAGVIDYLNGTFEIKIDLYPVSGPIKFTIIPESFDIVARRNVILEIDSVHSSVHAIEKDDKDLIKYNSLSRSF